MPVDLRARFPSRTIGNFTLNVYPEFDMERGGGTLRSLCAQMRHSMERATAKDQLAGRCASSALAGESWPMRLLPVGVKRFIVRRGLEAAENGSTLTFSNLGAVRLPEAMQSEVAELGFAFSAKPEAPYSCSVISTGDTLCLSLARAIREPVLEAQLEALLRRFEIDHEKWDAP